MLGAFVSVGLLVGYPIFGLKMPQKDNPFYWRKKYATPTSIEQFQALSLIEYGGKTEMAPGSNVILGPNGFDHANNGVRFDLDNYNDLVC